jgi:ABC-2 type transport system ATP-binding protein
MGGGIVARGLVRQFPGVRALDGLDLDVAQGELFGLVGPNGSGKTTLIRILVGLDSPTGGRATVLDARPGERARDVGYMPQEEALYADLSVMENLAFFAGLYGVDARERARAVLGLVRLWEDRDRLVGDLSGGMRRRVSLAVALLHDPLVLFLDEPTVGVDPLLRGEFWRAFRERAASGGSLLITTHHIEEARRCDRVGLLWRGRMLRVGTPLDLLREAEAESLEDAFARFVEREEHALGGGRHDITTARGAEDGAP